MERSNLPIEKQVPQMLRILGFSIKDPGYQYLCLLLPKYLTARVEPPELWRIGAQEFQISEEELAEAVCAAVRVAWMRKRAEYAKLDDRWLYKPPTAHNFLVAARLWFLQYEIISVSSNWI